MTETRPPKIAVITTVHNVDDNRIYWREGASLAKQYEVTIYGLRGPVIADTPQLRTSVLKLPGGRVARISIGPFLLVARALRDGADLIHFHDPEIIPAALVARRVTHIPVIFDNHEDYPEVMLSKHWLPKILRRPTSWLIGRGERIAAKHFDAVLAPTVALAERFARLGARAEVVKNFPPIGHGAFAQVNRVSRRSQDVVHLGTVSELRVPTFARIVAAVADLRPETTWKFIGLKPHVEAALRKSLGPPLSRQITAVPWVPAGEVPRELLECRVGLNFHPDTTQFRNAIPVKVIEYLACGLPIVTTPIHELEIGTGGAKAASVGVYVVPHDEARAAERIVEALGLPVEELERMSRNAVDLVREELAWESQETRILAVYAHVLKRKRTPGG